MIDGGGPAVDAESAIRNCYTVLNSKTEPGVFVWCKLAPPSLWGALKCYTVSLLRDRPRLLYARFDLTKDKAGRPTLS